MGAWSSGVVRRTHHHRASSSSRSVTPSIEASASRSSLLGRGVAASASISARRRARRGASGCAPRISREAPENTGATAGLSPRKSSAGTAWSVARIKPALTSRRSSNARDMGSASNASRRVQRAMYGEAGSCAWSPPTAAVAATGSSAQRRSRCWRASVARLSSTRDRTGRAGCGVNGCRAQPGRRSQTKAMAAMPTTMAAAVVARIDRYAGWKSRTSIRSRPDR